MGSKQATIKRLERLSGWQLDLVNDVLAAFERPINAQRSKASDVVSDEFLACFGDVLKLHHCLSDDYLDKHRFESAMVRVFKTIGKDATRAKSGNPGHDITVDRVPWSLKTQGDSKISLDKLHISKFMELGKGEWRTVSDLAALRDQFIRHMLAYDRIFQLRHFKREPKSNLPHQRYYELVEIPKALLQEAVRGEISMSTKSKQNPKPGYCTVLDDNGGIKYQLYFDAGTERKLQIKHLRKDLCAVHATWEF